MRVLITGMDGFVGGYLATELIDHGHQVIGTTIGPDRERFLHLELNDLSSIRRVLEEVRPDAIAHLAGFTSVKASWDQPEEALRVNRDGTKNLYTVLTELHMKPRVLITSTAEVYGIPQFLPMTETHPTNPDNPYAKSKLAQEEVTKEFPSIPTVIARSFPHIGPGQSTTFVTSSFAQQIVAIERGQQSALRVGNLDAQRDFTDVRDVVTAYRLLLEGSMAKEQFNVCSGQTLSIREVVDTLLALSTVHNITVETDPDRLRPSDIPVLQGDHSKLSQATGWEPGFSINTETLPAILQFFRDQ